MTKITNILLCTVLGVLTVLVLMLCINTLGSDKAVEDVPSDNNTEDYKPTYSNELLYNISLENGYVGEYSNWLRDMDNGTVSYRFLDQNIEWSYNTSTITSTNSKVWDLLHCSSTDNADLYYQIKSVNSNSITQYYVVSFNSNTDDQIENQVIRQGGIISEPVLKKDGYKFSGWKNNNTSWNASYDVVNSSMTLDAVWVDEANTITYHGVEGSTHSNPTTYTPGLSNIMLSAPVKEGFEFVGWYSDYYFSNQIAVIDTSVSAVYNVYARWTIKEYNISYNLNGGVNSTRNPIKYSAETEEPLQAPTKVGCTFVGWKLNGATFTNIVLKDLEVDLYLEAVWSPIVYNISYELNGGALGFDNPLTYTVNDSDITLNIPEKEGYTAYWSLSNNALVEVSKLSVSLLSNASSTNIKLYAYYVSNESDTTLYEGYDIFGNFQHYMYYGLYPQSVVDDADLIAALDSLKLTNINGYYVYNNEQYVKHTVSVIEEGYTYSNGEAVVDGEVKYFKLEPIKWRLIQSIGAIQVMSELILDSRVYYTTNVTRSVNGSTIYANNYLYSYANTVLEDVMFSKCFSKEHQSQVKTVSSSLGNLYALSYTSATNGVYGFTEDVEASNLRSAQVTDFALANDVRVYEDDCAEWWLSTTGTGSWNFARSVRNDGSIDTNRTCWTVGLGVRPALTFINE